jgi:hypothetical protein
MQGASSVCGQAARSPLIPRSPFSRGPRAPRRSGVRARPDRPVACPNMAYPVSRSPDAPLALLAARKMLQQQEFSSLHPIPAESMLLASVGRDCVRRTTADRRFTSGMVAPFREASPQELRASIPLQSWSKVATPRQ